MDEREQTSYPPIPVELFPFLACAYINISQYAYSELDIQ